MVGIMSTNGEPDPTRPPVNEFTNPDWEIIGENLGEVRGGIDEVDFDSISDFAFRGRLVLNAGRFKQNADQVIAPERQEEVFKRIRKIAEEVGGDIPGFPELMEDTWRFMVPRFVAMQQRAIKEHMRPVYEAVADAKDA